MRFNNIAGLASVALLILWNPHAHAFKFLQGHYKSTVVGNSITFHVDIPGVSDSGVPWNLAFSRAAEHWSMLTPVQVNTVKSVADPCHRDSISGVGFTNNCWAEHLATAATFRSDGMIAGADLTFDSNSDWDVFTGNSRLKVIEHPGGRVEYRLIYDFERVSLHEIGHALGLGHTNFPESIMSAAPDRGDHNEKLTADDFCGVNIAHGNPGGCLLILKNPATVSGKNTTAHFVGGVSRDRGLTYDTVFQRVDKLDVMATVVVEERHYHKPGRLHAVVELSDGALLMKTDTGFSAWDGTIEALRTTAVQPLIGANEIYVLKNFDLGANQVQNIGVSVYVGYSVVEEPGEVYYSGTPIKFRVQ